MTVEVCFLPIETWPGHRRPAHEQKRGPFGATLARTITDLEREIAHLGGAWVDICLGIEAADVRHDGKLRASARPSHPGVVVRFSTEALGEMAYAVDTYTDWHQNVRAVALGLAALRAVDRYGIGGRGEQYRGWQALPSGLAMGAPLTRDEAILILADLSGFDPVALRGPGLFRTEAYRAALKATHPDHGGDPALFGQLQRAWATIDQ